MKKYALVFVSVLFFFSCEKDDEKVVAAEVSIIGSWELIKHGTINNNIETLNDYQNSCNSKKDYVQYLENGTVKRYTYDNNCSESIAVFTWTKNGNILNTQSSSTSYPENEIVELTSTNLKLKFVTNTVNLNIFKRK